VSARYAARISVRVSPRSARDEVVGRHGHGWKLTVTAPPERGLANAAVTRLLAEVWGVPAGDVRVVIGHGARDKVIEVHGLTAAEAERRLAARQRKG
jgi:uncharacterized protein (TIGR00251 family)